MIESAIIEPSLLRRVRVLCVDDNRDLTAVLRECIEEEPDLECVGVLDSADDLVIEVKSRNPDVVLLDMTMPGRDPLAVLGDLTAAGSGGPGARVIVFSGRDAGDVMESAAEAGACGFLSKHAAVPLILRAIREAARSGAGDGSYNVWR